MARLFYQRLLLLGFLISPLALHAQDLAAWRGAWIADVDGKRAVMYLVLRDGKVSGTYCTDCTNPDFLAFVDDGVLDASGLRFKLYFDNGESAWNSPAAAELTDAGLHLTVDMPGGTDWVLDMRRAPPQETPPPVANSRPNQPDPGTARTLPGAAEAITPEKVLGLWLWGTGPTKQYFIFKRHKNGVRGMVCGPCDSAKDFAPLENVRMSGTNFHFEIVHEDNGIGFEENGPFSNVTDAQIALNEMHMTTYSSFAPEGRKYEMTLLGPVRYMPPGQP